MNVFFFTFQFNYYPLVWMSYNCTTFIKNFITTYVLTTTTIYYIAKVKIGILKYKYLKLEKAYFIL